jgi:hypothetical protein
VQIGDVRGYRGPLAPEGNPDGLAFTMSAPDHKAFIIAIDPKAALTDRGDAGLEHIVVHELVHVAHGVRHGEDVGAAFEWLVDTVADLVIERHAEGGDADGTASDGQDRRLDAMRPGAGAGPNDLDAIAADPPPGMTVIDDEIPMPPVVAPYWRNPGIHPLETDGARPSPDDTKPDLVFRTEDHPASGGRTPQSSDTVWTFAFRLDDGRVVHILAGDEGKRAMAACLFAHLADDAAEDAIGRAAAMRRRLAYGDEGRPR